MKKLKFISSNFKEIKRKIQKKELAEKAIFNFLNSYSIFLFNKHKNFRKKILEKGNLNFPDGFPVALWLSISNLKQVSRLKGPEFTHYFLSYKELNTNAKHYFIGMEEKDLDTLVSKYPNISRKNCLAYNLPLIKKKKFDDSDLIKEIKKFNPDYIWVGIGNPKQEILSNDIMSKIDQGYIFNVGAVFDYIKGTEKECPKMFRKLCLEWLYRLFTNYKKTSNKLRKSIIGIFQMPFSIRLRK